MRLSNFAWLPLAAGTALAAGCQQPTERREWRALSEGEKAGYISAVKCLTTKPSKIGLPTSLYEDFPWVHAQLNLDIHFVASFLPWHRWFVHLYETALKEDCGYQGAMPYWDWTLDSGTLPASPVFSESTTTGFGGTGNSSGWVPPSRPNPLVACVTTGAFANFTVTYYAEAERPHCLNRQFNNGTGSLPTDPLWQAALYSPAMIANITDTSATFETFWDRLENVPHGAIHFVIGGDMIPSTSPNDPLFFLHHAQVDRLWWIWQQKDIENRTTDFSGNKYPSPDETRASLEDIMTFEGLSSNITVADVMTTACTGELCYTYV